MPINPEEIAKVAQGVEKATAAIEKSGGVGKAAESIASKGEEVVQKATKSARTYARDARGRFASVAKGTAKTATAGGLGAAANEFLNKDSNSNNDNSQNNQSNPNSSTRPTQNPGANSPAGRIDLPHIDSAEDIAAGVDPSSFSDTRGLKGTSNQSENISNRKLNKIINLLESILSVEKRNTTMMGSGFRNVENAIYASHNAMVNRMQAQDMENTSSGQGGNFLSSVMNNPGKVAMGSLKSLSVAALGAFAAGAAIDVIKNHHTSPTNEAVRHSVTKTQEDIISTYKDEYGKRWAQKLVSDDFSQQQHNNGFLEELANNQGPAALYLPIKEAFDKASKRDKQEIIDAIAALLKVSPDKVQKQIMHENIRAVQVAKAAETGMMTAAVHAAAATVGGGIKYGGKAVGWLSSKAGSAFDFFGGYNVGAFLKKEGSTISKNATAKGDELSAKINKGTDYIPSTGKIQAFYNPNSYKSGEMAFDVGTAAFVPGGKIRAASMLAAGGLDLLGNDSSYFGNNTFQLGGQQRSKMNGKLSADVQARAKKAIAFFQSKGWSKDQAAAIVGNLIQESNLDPNAVNPTSKARGIAQWLGPRVKDFEKQEHTPLEGSKFEQQLDFVNWELNHSEKKAGDSIRATTNISDATAAVANKYERMGANESMMDRRLSYAEAVSKQFDSDSIKPQTQIASTAAPPAPIVVSQGGTNISRNTTIQSASAAAPLYLQDNVTSSI